MKILTTFILSILFLVTGALSVQAEQLLVPMDHSQKNHLQAYGAVYQVLQNNQTVQWLLNYKGGAFAFEQNEDIEEWLNERGIVYTGLKDGEWTKVKTEIRNKVDMSIVSMEIMPKIAVFAPVEENLWDDAVMMALDHAEIPYTVISDKDVLKTNLNKYDFIHLHHEDFTGQHNRMYHAYGTRDWYKEQVHRLETVCHEHGFEKVSQMRLAVAKKLRKYIKDGGAMFAMCSATDTYDIALAAEGADICHPVFDGDAMDENVDEKLHFENTLAFEDFKVVKKARNYEYSNIDATLHRQVSRDIDHFNLERFSASENPLEAMLTQNHTQKIKGFMGATTAFNKSVLKENVTILAEPDNTPEARYIHGTLGKGTWTFYGGHDPEDYRHFVGEPKTDLKMYPNSPGYRIILNNVLMPSVKREKLKTVSKNNDVINIYPNPSRGKINLTFLPDQLKSGVLEVYDINGKIVYTRKLEQLDKGLREKINLRTLPAGVYQVHIGNKEQSFYQKLIIQ